MKNANSIFFFNFREENCYLILKENQRTAIFTFSPEFMEPTQTKINPTAQIICISNFVITQGKRKELIDAAKNSMTDISIIVEEEFGNGDQEIPDYLFMGKTVKRSRAKLRGLVLYTGRNDDIKIMITTANADFMVSVAQPESFTDVSVDDIYECTIISDAEPSLAEQITLNKLCQTLMYRVFSSGDAPTGSTTFFCEYDISPAGELTQIYEKESQELASPDVAEIGQTIH